MNFVPPKPPLPASDLGLFQTARTAARNPLELWPERYYREPTIARRMAGMTQIVTSDLDFIRQVMGDARQHYEKQVVTRRILLPQAGYGVFLTEGEQWKRQRRILSPAFTPRNIEKLLPHFMTAIRQWIDDAVNENSANLSNELQRLTLKVATQSMFTVAIDDTRERRIIDMFRDYAFNLGAPRWYDLIAKTETSFGLLTRKRWKFQREWYGIIEAFIAERPARNAASGERDVYELLSEARSEDGDRLSEAEIIDEIATLTAAGFETTARSMFWTFYLLAHFPEWQEELRAEIASIPALFDTPTLAKIDKLEKTKAVWQEGMRLYPPGSLITRQAMSAHAIGDRTIAKGTLVVISPWLVHRHHAYWSEPDQFDPRRFLGERGAAIPKGAYIPFGLGARICLGAQFATAEAMLMIAAVIARWRVTLVDKEPPVPMMLTATMPSYEPNFRLEKI